MKMNAAEMVKKFGDKLIGCYLETMPIGTWPGGLCRVVDLGDENSPEIVMNVNHSKHGEVGIFDCEDLEVNAEVPGNEELIELMKDEGKDGE